MENITIENLISAGAHFGHLTSKWNPKMKKFVFMEKNGIHVIDLEQTLKALEKATKYVGDVVRNGGGNSLRRNKETGQECFGRRSHSLWRSLHH